ncbi:MAG: hypothetical protein EOP49_34000 [Sphingobacteriales bacterium]|nr:MAG: hypothetical protein EOP49_34000 [Sphingobacteriales bacterium]
MSLVTRADTAEYEVRKLMEKQHLFVMETITRRNFMAPALSKEVVLASRMSGFKQARFAFLASDLQPFSMYNDFILLSGRSYLNPLSQGSTRKFNFLIEDTTYTGTDTVFVISFSPAKGKNFEALKGLLYINSDGWALQNIIAQPVEGDLKGMRIQQMYEKPDGEHWFPVQLNTDFVIPNVELGGHLPTAISRSYITNIDLNPQLRRRDFDAVAVEIEPMAHARENGFWQQHRSDSLDLREEKTYQVLDSLGEENNFDKKLKIFESLISGRYPLGYVDFDVTRLLDVNRYEGVRLGAGLYTSERVSKFFTVGGYGAYGFRDKGFKYGADGTFFLYRPLSLELKVTWFEDIKESGGTFLPFKRRGIVSNELRHLVLDNMDKTKHQSAFISFRTLKFLQLTTGLRHEYKRTTNGYQFETQPDQWNSKFRFTDKTFKLMMLQIN